MNSKILMRKALSMCLMVAVYATYSMVVLAASERTVGELSVAGKNSTVTVNGEAAQSGRSVFSSSTIVTPEDTNAIINIAKVGKVELAPNTTFTVSFDENKIDGNLTAGKVTVLSAADSVNLIMPDGKNVKLNAGESAAAGAAQDDDDDDDMGGGGWLVWALVFGGAAAALVIAATTDNNRAALGGGSTVVSPAR